MAMGRRASLFAKSERGGDRAAAILLLIGTAMFNGLDTEPYPRRILTHSADHAINRIDQLLPRNVQTPAEMA